MARLFVSQAQMDKWTAEGKVRLEDDVMLLPALGRSFKLEPAVHISKVVEGTDTQQLVNRVKTRADLDALGAEHYGASLIMGEVGYECTEGFLGSPTEGGGPVGGSGLIRLGG